MPSIVTEEIHAQSLKVGDEINVLRDMIVANALAAGFDKPQPFSEYTLMSILTGIMDAIGDNMSEFLMTTWEEVVDG